MAKVSIIQSGAFTVTIKNRVNVGRITASRKAARKKASSLKMKRITAKQRAARKVNILKAQEAARRKRRRSKKRGREALKRLIVSSHLRSM